MKNNNFVIGDRLHNMLCNGELDDPKNLYNLVSRSRPDMNRNDRGRELYDLSEFGIDVVNASNQTIVIEYDDCDMLFTIDIKDNPDSLEFCSFSFENYKEAKAFLLGMSSRYVRKIGDMVNTDLFIKIMKSKGFTIRSLARRMGINEITLAGKIKNRDRFGGFTISERFFIRNLFDITKEEEIEVFGKEEVPA